MADKKVEQPDFCTLDVVATLALHRSEASRILLLNLDLKCSFYRDGLLEIREKIRKKTGKFH